MGLAFFGNADPAIVAAMLVEKLELFPPLITIGNRMLPQPMHGAHSWVVWFALFALWPPLPLHPDRYSTDRAHACDGAVVVEFDGARVYQGREG
jgi:hypothetical protein